MGCWGTFAKLSEITKNETNQCGAATTSSLPLPRPHTWSMAKLAHTRSCLNARRRKGKVQIRRAWVNIQPWLRAVNHHVPDGFGKHELPIANTSCNVTMCNLVAAFRRCLAGRDRSTTPSRWSSYPPMLRNNRTWARNWRQPPETWITSATALVSTTL